MTSYSSPLSLRPKPLNIGETKKVVFRGRGKGAWSAAPHFGPRLFSTDWQEIMTRDTDRRKLAQIGQPHPVDKWTNVLVVKILVAGSHIQIHRLWLWHKMVVVIRSQIWQGKVGFAGGWILVLPCMCHLLLVKKNTWCVSDLYSIGGRILLASLYLANTDTYESQSQRYLSAVRGYTWVGYIHGNPRGHPS